MVEGAAQMADKAAKATSYAQRLRTFTATWRGQAGTVGHRNWFGSLVTLVGMLAGFYVSVYSSEIKNAVRGLSNFTLHADVSHLLVAAVATLAFGIVLAAHLAAQKTQTETVQDFARAQGDALLAKLNDLLSIPPQGFMRHFQELHNDVSLLTFTPSGDPKYFDDRVRLVLRAIASLTQRYDNAGADTQYTACLYLYHARADLDRMPAQARAQLLQHLKFTENAAAQAAGLAAVLELRQGLCASTHDGKDWPGSPVEPLTLGIADPPSMGDKASTDPVWKVLPGAPWSALTGEYFVAPTIDDAMRWMQSQADFTKQVTQEFQAYFAAGAGRTIKSFASVPITFGEFDAHAPVPAATAATSAPPVPGGTQPQRVIGVLTIHSSAPYLLRSAPGSAGLAKAIFIPLLQPFLTTLIVETLNASRLAQAAADPLPPAHQGPATAG
jgi:hypothetical protein